MTNIKMNLKDVSEDLATRDFYGKVMKSTANDSAKYVVRFTSTSPEIAAYFQALRQYAGKKPSTDSG